METVKIKMTDGSVQTIQGNIEQVTIKDLEETKEWKLKTVETNGATLVTPHVGGRPDDR